jgi:hypothetical protein
MMFDKSSGDSENVKLISEPNMKENFKKKFKPNRITLKIAQI